MTSTPKTIRKTVVWRLANLYPVRTILASNYPQEPQHLVLYFGIDPRNRDSKPSVELLADLVKMGFEWNGYGWKINRAPDEEVPTNNPPLSEDMLRRGYR